MHPLAHGRLLIVRLSAIGDVITSLPTLASLRMQLPEAHIAWVTEEGPAQLLDRHPHLDELFIVPLKKWRRAIPRPVETLHVLGEAFSTYRHLRSLDFDVILDLQGNLKSALTARFFRTTRRLGYPRGRTREGNHLFSTESIPLPAREPPRVQRSLAALAALGLEPRYEPTRLFLDESHTTEALAVSGPSPLIVLHPGSSSFGAFKRWPAENYALLARQLQAWCGGTILVTCGSGEEHLANTVERESRGAARAVPPFQGGLKTLAALLLSSHLTVAADTAPLHLASCLGRPVVALFGPKNPEIYGPVGSPSRIVRVPLPCSPCTRRRCPDPICMTRLPVNQVFDACRELLHTTNSEHHHAR